MKRVAIFNEKGGVGKTTTSVNLAACLADAGKKVLMVDLDPQGNTTSGLGCTVSERNSIYDAMMGRARFEDCIQKTEQKKLKLVGSDIRLAGAEVELVSVKEREYYLKKLLAPSRGDFDFIIIDCPPSLSLLTLNAMAAADSVLVPIQCEYYALEGVKSLMDTINRVKRSFNPRLEIEGILLTMLDGRTNLGLQVVLQGVDQFPLLHPVILLEDLVGHDDFISAFDKVAAVQNEVHWNSAEVQMVNDLQNIRDVAIIAQQIIRPILKVEHHRLLELDWHVVTCPHVLVG